MREQSSNIVVAVDAELTALERRVRTLREIKRLALELDEDRPPKAAATTPPIATRKRRRGQAELLTAADVIEVARGLVADGPTTVGRILGELGRSRTPGGTAAVEAALAQLGATVCGRARGGGELYALPAQPDKDGEHGRSELVETMRELAKSAVGWSDEEFQYQLRKRCGIEASVAEIREARAELNGATA